MNKKLKGLLIAFGIFLLLLVIIIIGSVWFASNSAKFKDASRTKVMQSEAKTSLAMLYTAQKSYYAEFGEYTSSIKDLENPQEGYKNRYKFGFVNLFPPSTAEVKSGVASLPNFDPSANNSDLIKTDYHSDEIKNINFEEWGKKFGCEVSKEKFKACAVGIVTPDGQIDVWSIDQDKNLKQETGFQ